MSTHAHVTSHNPVANTDTSSYTTAVVSLFNLTYLFIYFPLLNVASEPTITSYKSNVYTNEGDEITLQVDFKGVPKPSITWFFNGIRLDDDTSTGEPEVTDEGFLHIPQVSRDHAGTYDFIVSNSVGSVEGCTKLIVYLKERAERKIENTKIFSKPVDMDIFGEYVAKNHKNGDSGFVEEFEVRRKFKSCTKNLNVEVAFIFQCYSPYTKSVALFTTFCWTPSEAPDIKRRILDMPLTSSPIQI